MAADNSLGEPADRTTKRRHFSSWVKRIAQFKGGDQNHSGGRKHGPASGAAKQKTSNGLDNKHEAFTQSSRRRHESSLPSRTATADQTLTASPIPRMSGNDRGSYDSLTGSCNQHDLDEPTRSNKSGAPTLATNPDTINSDAGQSRAATTTTGAGAFSSLGGNSTFSSPNQSVQSLTTTLTTIHSHSPGNAIQRSSTSNPNGMQHDVPSNPHNVMFSHQYPISPAHSTANTISAIPRYMNDAIPSTYASATANNLLSDNASMLTLASSSKRRRRSLESHTDASVRAIPPSSIWSGSRESLPLSVLSGNVEPSSGPYTHTPSRPSLSGLPSAERTSIYSSQGIAAPALASERNSYYAASQKHNTKDIGDAKSLRSITNIDARSQYDTRSINDAKSMDLASLRNYEGSVRSGTVSHARNDSIPGSTAGVLPPTPGSKQSNFAGAARRSGDWQEGDERGD